jgi:pyruvate/2-oxoglutarate dehydrogenase complex dihydrolipoamide dehydrogenase (E3) component
MDNQTFDVLIIGGGQAGVPLAWSLAQAGKRVALAERKNLGGSCVNFGCTPTKAAISSARVAHLARRGAEFGLKIPQVEVDFPAVIRRARSIALDSRNGLDKGLEPSDNPKLIRGHARLAGRDEHGFRIVIGEQRFHAGQIVLNVGTRRFLPPLPGLDRVDVLHSDNWLEQEQLPESLAVLGGGYIGLEMGQFYRRMGSHVTILERGPRIVAHEDEDISSELQARLEAEGIAFRLNTAVNGVEKTSDGVQLKLEQSGATAELSASHLFVATGRQPNTDDLGLETVGVTTTKTGIVPVDERLATNIAGIWAAGDIRGGPQFTHTSWDDNRILMSQLTGDGTRTTRRIIPYAIFTDPEVGRVGMTEAEARQAGKTLKTAKFGMTHSGKAAEIGETEGFIKVMIDVETKRFLGAALICADAAELVHLIIDVMTADAPYTVIRDAIHIHPTLAEAVQSAVANLD